MEEMTTNQDRELERIQSYFFLGCKTNPNYKKTSYDSTGTNK
jgi:hypothetical protein